LVQYIRWNNFKHSNTERVNGSFHAQSKTSQRYV